MKSTADWRAPIFLERLLVFDIFFAFPCRQDVGPKWKNRLTQKQWKYQLIPGLLVLLVWTGGITLQLYLASRHWLPVCFRLDFQILLITFGACCGLALHYVASLSEATLDPEDLWNSLPEKIQFAPICTEVLCSMWFKLFSFIHSFYGFINIVAEFLPFILFILLFYQSSLLNCCFYCSFSLYTLSFFSRAFAALLSF